MLTVLCLPYTWSCTRPEDAEGRALVSPATNDNHIAARSDPFHAAKQVRVTNRESETVATLTGGRTARLTLPPCDTPGVIHPVPDGLSRTAAETAWRAAVPSIAATPQVRVSWDGGRTYPARHAGPMPASPPSRPATR